MKILMIDTYKNVPYRISKDTSGGYGTGNNFGSNNFFLIRVLIKLYLKILGKSSNLVANEIITLIKKDRLNSKFKIKKKFSKMIYLLISTNY